jgi:hypothetical protein
MPEISIEHGKAVSSHEKAQSHMISFPGTQHPLITVHLSETKLSSAEREAYVIFKKNGILFRWPDKQYYSYDVLFRDGTVLNEAYFTELWEKVQFLCLIMVPLVLLPCATLMKWSLCLFRSFLFSRVYWHLLAPPLTKKQSDIRGFFRLAVVSSTPAFAFQFLMSLLAFYPQGMGGKLLIVFFLPLAFFCFAVKSSVVAKDTLL